MSQLTANWLKPSLIPPVHTLLNYSCSPACKAFEILNINKLISTTQVLSSSFFFFTRFDIGVSFSSPTSIFLICALLSPSSGQCVLLWPVFLLLLHGARGVWDPPGPGGLAGRDAARPVAGQTQELEVSMETLLQPQQAGAVSRPGNVELFTMRNFKSYQMD